MSGLLLAILMSARIASDFEIAQMKEQLSRSRDFSARISARLNLGDLYGSRSEKTAAAAEYEEALKLSSAERASARKASDLWRYAMATSYAGLASAKLRREVEAFGLLEEAVRYESDSAETWNVYAAAMSILRKREKAISAARNAVAIARREGDQLDLAVCEYALASASGDVELLERVVERLGSPAFDDLRREIARAEAFEVYSTARGDAAAYLSLLNRSQLELGKLLEARGDIEAAKKTYRRVLQSRTDDATALAALARLASTGREREQYFEAAFDANPFSMALIREYRKHIDPKYAPEATGVRLALLQIARGQTRAARTTLEALLEEHPKNETLLALRAEVTPSAFTPEQRKALDAQILTATAVFHEASANEGRTVLESGTIGKTPFRFSQPTVFQGTFAAGVPLRLTYRILGPTAVGDADGLLLEPLRLEVIQ
jgi:tetratricopeptide (TPR) repeat protein